ncbi:hypothetical protein [Desulfoscipio sp. XC116]|uniref:hypothetical protein n=1 Tax=Desulfoscipio sp. XC116 TaxID=3144975 RepID=UPI00325C0C20
MAFAGAIETASTRKVAENGTVKRGGTPAIDPVRDAEGDTRHSSAGCYRKAEGTRAYDFDATTAIPDSPLSAEWNAGDLKKARGKMIKQAWFGFPAFFLKMQQICKAYYL